MLRENTAWVVLIRIENQNLKRGGAGEGTFTFSLLPYTLCLGEEVNVMYKWVKLLVGLALNSNSAIRAPGML